MGSGRGGRAGLWFVAGILALGLAVPQASAISWGQRAPAFTLVDVSGHPTTLGELLRNHQAVVLALGTAWSYKFPSWAKRLQRLAERYDDGRVMVAAVFLKDQPQKVRLFANRYGLNRGKILLLVDSTGSLIQPYGLREIPRLLLLDPAGTIHYDGTVEHIDDSVAKLLSGEAVEARQQSSAFTKPSEDY